MKKEEKYKIFIRKFIKNSIPQVEGVKFETDFSGKIFIKDKELPLSFEVSRGKSKYKGVLYIKNTKRNFFIFENKYKVYLPNTDKYTYYKRDIRMEDEKG